MTTRIDRAVTEVIAEPEVPASSAGGDSRPQETDRLRRLMERLQRQELRTRAEGFDD